MWKQVLPDDMKMVNKAYEILVLHADLWNSPRRLSQWIRNRGVKLFCGEFKEYKLVIGFRADKKDRPWRIATIGADGTFSSEMLEAAIDKGVEFAKEHKLREISAITDKRQVGDPIKMVFQAAVDRARKNPSISKVEETDTQIAHRFRIELKAPVR